MAPLDRQPDRPREARNRRRKNVLRAAPIGAFAAIVLALGIAKLSAASLEYEVKAAYLLKFAEFVDWR